MAQQVYQSPPSPLWNTFFFTTGCSLSKSSMSKYETLGRSLLPPLEAGWSLGGRIGAKLEGWIRCWALGATGRQQGWPKWPKWVEVAQVEKEPPQQIPRQPLPRNPSSVFCNNKYCYFLALKTLACKLYLSTSVILRE